MARIKIDLPVKFSFSTTIPIRITDINFGGHVGNDTILSIVHEARAKFFQHFGYDELNFWGGWNDHERCCDRIQRSNLLWR